MSCSNIYFLILELFFREFRTLVLATVLQRGDLAKYLLYDILYMIYSFYNPDLFRKIFLISNTSVGRGRAKGGLGQTLQLEPELLITDAFSSSSAFFSIFCNDINDIM